MRFAYRSLLFVLVSSLLGAQENLPGVAAAAEAYPAASGGSVSSGGWDSARLSPPYSPQASLAGPSIVSGMPLAFVPEPRQSPGGSAAQTPPKEGNWVVRHAVFLAGLAMTGGGTALMATGGPGQFSGCYNAGLYGQPVCATASTWGASGRHLAGLLLVCAGVPTAIIGLIKHH
jgi:hypothetical protein